MKIPQFYGFKESQLSVVGRRKSAELMQSAKRVECDIEPVKGFTALAGKQVVENTPAASSGLFNIFFRRFQRSHTVMFIQQLSQFVAGIIASERIPVRMPHPVITKLFIGSVRRQIRLLKQRGLEG